MGWVTPEKEVPIDFFFFFTYFIFCFPKVRYSYTGEQVRKELTNEQVCTYVSTYITTILLQNVQKELPNGKYTTFF